jgi:hypothetical protein
LDYSGLHINMLYALEKLPMPKGDVYHLEGYSNDKIFRDFVKKLLLIMINSSDRSKARKAIHSEVYYTKTLILPSEIPSVKSKDLYPLMDAFQKKHDPIKGYFCTGKGIDLQYLDSQMAEKVMLHFSKMGYAILPVHDSFIIHHGLESELKKAMNNAFYDLFGTKIKVDLKYRSIEERDKKKPPKPPIEEWTPEYIKGREDKSKIKDIIAWQKPYSKYWQLWEEHLELIRPKGPSDDSDIIDVPMD